MKKILTAFTFLIFTFIVSQSPVSAQDVLATKFGILYETHQCRFSQNPLDITKILAGEGNWGNVQAVHWWGEPKLGYYCLTNSDDVLKIHAEDLRDAGIDFIVFDVSNYPNAGTTEATTDIEQPFNELIKVWSTIPNAPRIVPWFTLGTNDTMANWILGRLNQHPDMYFFYQGKPLILAVANPLFTIDENRINSLTSANYVVRKMWANTSNAGDWGFLEPCQNHQNFVDSQGTIPCLQAPSKNNGSPEELSITAAYQVRSMSDKTTAAGKFNGNTLRQQFYTLYNYPGIPIAIFTNWNEWIAPRMCLDKDGNIVADNCQTYFWPDGSPIFLDEYNVYYNRDIEPSTGINGDYYYQLMKSEIALYRSGRNCVNTIDTLACMGYRDDWRNFIQKTSDLNLDHVVDIFDYNLLTANFGNPYTMTDYNNLLANFGK